MQRKSPAILTVSAYFLFVVALRAAEPTTKPAAPSPERIKAVRGMYEKLPADILEFAEPAKVLPGMWADFNGEAIRITLVDSKKKQLTIELESATQAMSMSKLTPRAALGIGTDAAKQGEGVLITGINPGSPAEAAGLKVGDIMMKLDDQPVKKERLFVLFDGRKPGEKVAITIKRDGKEQVVNATFAAGGGGAFDPLVRLPSRGPEESAIYGLLLRLSKDDRKAVEPFLNVLDERIAGAIPK